jgi:multiple sugar transport system substrate-binding protein
MDVNGTRSNEPGFQAAEIFQTGYHPQWSHPNFVGTFWGSGQIYVTETLTSTATIPDPWKTSWHWWFDGVWGEQPFIASGRLAASEVFGNGNLFNSGRVAMSQTQLWYTCCIQDAGMSWDIAALPTYGGEIHGRLDELTFRIWKGTQYPDAAFEVLTYLTGPDGVQPLLLGNDAYPGGAYNALPALPEFQEAYIELLAAQYPHVENWNLFLQSQNYPDIPSAESWMPNFEQAWTRIGDFQMLIENEGTIDVDVEIEILEADLEAIFRGEIGD